MTAKEQGIMKDVNAIIDRFGEPPPITVKTALAVGWWSKLFDALQDMNEKWKLHPMAVMMGTTAFEYIEVKAKVKAGQEADVVSRK